MFRKILERLSITSKKPTTNEAIEDALKSIFDTNKEGQLSSTKEEREKSKADWESFKKESSGARELREQLEFVEELKKIPVEKPVENFERSVGEKFEYESTILEGVLTPNDRVGCNLCFFDKPFELCGKSLPIRGTCHKVERKDHKEIHFIKAIAMQTKQPQEDIKLVPKNLAKFPHYFAKVPNFTHLDIYMVSEMFKLNSYQHHGVKKLIAAGNRGSKDRVKDLQEVIATVEGWLEVIKSEEL